MEEKINEKIEQIRDMYSDSGTSTDIEIEDKPEKKYYFVTSIFLNAYLQMKGFKIVKTSKLDNGKIAFFYNNVKELHQTMKEYKENVELKEFVCQYHNVLNVIKAYR